MCTFPYVPILLCVRMGVLYSKICVDSLLSLLPVSRERGDVKWGTQAIQAYEKWRAHWAPADVSVMVSGRRRMSAGDEEKWCGGTPHTPHPARRPSPVACLESYVRAITAERGDWRRSVSGSLSGRYSSTVPCSLRVTVRMWRRSWHFWQICVIAPRIRALLSSHSTCSGRGRRILGRAVYACSTGRGVVRSRC